MNDREMPLVEREAQTDPPDQIVAVDNEDWWRQYAERLERSLASLTKEHEDLTRQFAASKASGAGISAIPTETAPCSGCAAALETRTPCPHHPYEW